MIRIWPSILAAETKLDLKSRGIRGGWSVKRYVLGCLVVVAYGYGPGTLPVSALDFRLHSTMTEEDGLKRERVSFQNDASTQVIISPPAGWSRSDDVNSLTLIPPNITNGMVKIERSSIGPSVAFQAPGSEVFRRRMLAEIPQGVTAMKFGEETVDPLPVFGWKSHEYAASYDFFGQSYCRSVLFLNLNAKEQLMITMIGLKADFERVHSAGMDVMRSWQIVPTHN